MSVLKLNVDFWDGDDFGARKEKSRSLPSPASPAYEQAARAIRHRRTSSISISPPRTRSRTRSPPPTPSRRAAPPPVPPIPAYLIDEGARTPVIHPRQLSRVVPVIHIPDLTSDLHIPMLKGRKSSREAMTCLKFFSIHNNRNSSQ